MHVRLLNIYKPVERLLIMIKGDGVLALTKIKIAEFVVSGGKIMLQSFAAKVTPKH